MNHDPGKPCANGKPMVLTIGHSTRTLGAFLRLLQAHGVTCLADVRTIPRSRHNPQFNGVALAKSLREAGIGYLSMGGLGGLRHPLRDSSNTGWRNESFRGFADYMQTLEFERGLDELITVAKYERIALMCAEAVPWRCHRSLIADALLARGIPVEHILSGIRRQIHSLTPFARVRGARITYPSPHLPAAHFGKPKQRKRNRMKKNLIPAFAAIAVAMALGPAAFGKGKEVTITGQGQCAKCSLHETKSCQNTITVEEHGKKVTYYLAPNKVSKAFHDNICKTPAKVTATGAVKDAHGRMELTATKIELAK